METRYVREFMVAAEIGNYFEASEILSISQSSLSKHIMALENDIGQPLFERIGRRCVLSDFGKFFLPYAKELSLMESRYLRDLKQYEQRDKKVIAVGCEYRVFEELAGFRKANSGYMLEFIGGREQGKTEECLRKGECEVAFLFDNTDRREDFSAVPYVKDCFVAVVYKGHPLEAKESVTLESLKDEPFVLFSKESVHSALAIELCGKYGGFLPEIVCKGLRGSDIVNLVSKKMGISLMLEKTLKVIKTDDIIAVPVFPRVEFSVSLYYRKNTALSKGAEKFINYIQQKNLTESIE